MKKQQEQMVTVSLLEAKMRGTLHKHDDSCQLWITFVESNKKRDLDNITIATKFIQDAMVKFGIFPDDSTKYINLLHYTVAFDKKHPCIIVTIKDNMETIT